MRIIGFSILGTAILIGTENVHSQGPEASIYIQPQVTNIIFHISESNSSVTSSPTGNLHAGINLTYFTNEKLGFGTGISIGNDGETINIERRFNNVTVESADYKYIFTVLKIPFQIRYHLMTRKGVRLMFDGGPHLDYILKAVNRTDAGTYNYADDYSRLQVGFEFGFGTGIPVRQNVLITIKPTIAFTNLGFRYTQENYKKNFPIGRNLVKNNLGLQFGLIYVLNKTLLPADPL